MKEDRLVVPSQRVKWEKIDKEEYNRAVTGKNAKQRQDIASEGVLDAQISKLNQIVVQAAEAQGAEESSETAESEAGHLYPRD